MESIQAPFTIVTIIWVVIILLGSDTNNGPRAIPFEVGGILGMTYLHFSILSKLLSDIHVTQFLVSRWLARSVRRRKPSGLNSSADQYWTTSDDIEKFNLFSKMSGVVWTAVEFNALNKKYPGLSGHSLSDTGLLTWLTGLSGPWIISPPMNYRSIIQQESLLLIRSVLPEPGPENPVHSMFIATK